MDTTVLKADLAAQIAENPVELEWGDQKVAAARGDLAEDAVVRSAGFMRDYLCSFVTQVESWTGAKPTAGEVVIVAEVKYRVLRVAQDGLAVGMRLDCGSEFSGADG